MINTIPWYNSMYILPSSVLEFNANNKYFFLFNSHYTKIYIWCPKQWIWIHLHMCMYVVFYNIKKIHSPVFHEVLCNLSKFFIVVFFKVVVDLANRCLKLCQCFLIWFNEEPILRSSLEESPVLEILHNYGVIGQKALYFTGHGLDICKIMWSKWNILDYCIWGVDACKMLFLFQNPFFC